MEYSIMKPEEMQTCAEIAAAAFADYDFFSVYVPGRLRRAAFLRHMFRTEFKVNAGRVHVLTAKENGKIAAVAVLHAPGYESPDIRSYIKAGFWKSLLAGGYKNVAAWFSMDQKAGIPCQNLGKNSWFLHLLAVDVSMEGKGIGSRMIQECMIPYVTEHGGDTMCLYTNSEINRKFYEKNGFTQFHEQYFSYRDGSFGSWSYSMDLNETNR